MAGFLGVDELFEGRHFDREVIVLCVRWYLRFKLSYRDLVEMMEERHLHAHDKFGSGDCRRGFGGSQRVIFSHCESDHTIRSHPSTNLAIFEKERPSTQAGFSRRIRTGGA